VTRYFGGVLLGTGGLIRAYTNAAKEALSVCRLGELTEGVHAFLDVDYNYVGKVQYICAQNDITIVNTDDGECSKKCSGKEYDRDVIGKDMLKGYMQHADVQR